MPLSTVEAQRRRRCRDCFDVVVSHDETKCLLLGEVRGCQVLDRKRRRMSDLVK